jgi:hypothetical protein
MLSQGLSEPQAGVPHGLGARLRIREESLFPSRIGFPLGQAPVA